ncbi:MAG TPA: CocE/NonD family hydrolase [Deltaproteobacteria bacterium]|nr:CocE/NonD family hydrolase [Deltaproteobacteria bacterium]HOI07036.1 CocE/NonD family hydrolase [Deltaproteobacteria bacterium]
MKVRIVSVVCLVLFALAPAALAGVLGDEALDRLDSGVSGLGIKGLAIDLNACIQVPGTPDQPAARLYATVIRHEGRKLPTILVATPYRREIMMLLYLPLLCHDYNLVAVDIRGTGSSAGEWVSFGPEEHLDTAYVIDGWIPSQAWSDGRVGMIGPSYMAIIQMHAAGQIETDSSGNPVHLKALFPIVSMSDAYRDIVMHGGNVDLEFIPMWLGMVDLLGILPPLLYGGGETPSLSDLDRIAECRDIWQEHYRSIPIHLGWIFDGNNTLKNAFYETKSPMIYWPDKPDGGWNFPEYPYLDVGTIPEGLPVFMTGGWFDIFTRGTLNNFQYGLACHKPGDRALIMGPWYHIDGAMGLGLNRIITGELPARWFDWKIKGIGDPFMVDYPVLLYVDGVKRWRAEKDWPLPACRTAGKTLYLSKKPASLVSGDWFSSTNKGNNYRLVETPTADDYTKKTLLGRVKRADPELKHDPTSLHGWESRSSVRWNMGLSALMPQISKLLLGLDYDSKWFFDDERTDEVGVLTFTTEPLKSDLEICGPLLLTFWARTDFTRELSAAKYTAAVNKITKTLNIGDSLPHQLLTRKDVQWVVEVNDVFPDGRARNLSSGWLSAWQRPYDPANRQAIDPAYLNDPFDPFYCHGNKHPDPIAENKTYAYAVEVWPMDNVFKKGHRIRVSLSASDFPHLMPVLIPSKNTIVIDADHPAKLQFTSVNSSGEGVSWKWVDKPDTYLKTHRN